MFVQRKKSLRFFFEISNVASVGDLNAEMIRQRWDVRMISHQCTCTKWLSAQNWGMLKFKEVRIVALYKIIKSITGVFQCVLTQPSRTRLQQPKSLSTSCQTRVISLQRRMWSLFPRWNLNRSPSRPVRAPPRAPPTARPRRMELFTFGFGNSSRRQRRQRAVFRWNWSWRLRIRSCWVLVRCSWWMCSWCRVQRQSSKMLLPTANLVGVCPKISVATKASTRAIASAASPRVITASGASKRSSLTPARGTRAASAGKHSNTERFSGGTSDSTPEINHTRVRCAQRRLRSGRASADTSDSTTGRGHIPAHSAARASVCVKTWNHIWGFTAEKSLSAAAPVGRCSGSWGIWRNTIWASVDTLSIHLRRLLASSCWRGLHHFLPHANLVQTHEWSDHKWSALSSSLNTPKYVLRSDHSKHIGRWSWTHVAKLFSLRERDYVLVTQWMTYSTLPQFYDESNICLCFLSHNLNTEPPHNDLYIMEKGKIFLHQLMRPILTWIALFPHLSLAHVNTQTHTHTKW